MHHVFWIFFGALLTCGTACSLGALSLRLLKLRLHPGEVWPLAFVTGSAVLSTLVFLLCTLHIAYKAAYVAIAATAIISELRLRVKRPLAQASPRETPRLFHYVFLAIFLCFGVFYLVNAAAPEMSPDGTAYHLAIVDHYNRAHGFEKVPTDMYFNMSQGLELLFLMAFAFGKHSAAALVHLAFLFALPWMIVAYARRSGFERAGYAAAAFVFASPVVGIDGASAYVDVGLTAVVFGLFFVLQIWDAERSQGWLWIAGALAGFAFAIKYTGGIAAIYAVAYVAIRRRPARPPQAGGPPHADSFKAVAALTLATLLFALPWPIKNWMWVQNPVAPFANRIFPNRWVHASFEREYQEGLRTYELPDRRRIPLEVILRGEALGGFLGPLFLLSPFALLALRTSVGRRLLLAALLFALPYLDNIGTRFLLPSLPFLSLALALAFSSLPALLFGLMLAHAILSTPWVAPIYCGRFAWRLDSFPIAAALRSEPEDTFLAHNWPGYVTDRLIERLVPPGQPIFLFGATAESYTTRLLLVRYLSAPNEVAGDILRTPVIPDFQPATQLTWRFPRRAVTRLRLVQTAGSNEEQWSVSEVRLLSAGTEIPRNYDWKLRAHPNPWDVQLAFDNSPVTRWRTWQAASPGDYIEMRFPSPVTFDELHIESPQDYTSKQVRLELDGVTISAPQASTLPIKVNLRRAAADEIKSRGIHYLLLSTEDETMRDLRQHASAWGFKKLGEAGVDQIYRIE